MFAIAGARLAITIVRTPIALATVVTEIQDAMEAD